MKVIGGSLKGRNLGFKRTEGLRPTKNIVREALFDIAGDRIAGCRMLELFAGTGAIGIESISRGASFVIFVEIREESLDLIRKNLKDLGVMEKAGLLESSVESALRKFAREGETFDFIFADSPYDYGEDRLRKLFRGFSAIISSGGEVVLELSSKTAFAQGFDGWEVVKERKYGSTKLQFYRKKGKDGCLSGQF